MTALRLLNHSAIYALGTILRNISSLVMLPIYTKFLTPEDYGVLELLSSIISFAGIIVGMRIGQTVLRYYGIANSDEERMSSVNSAQLTAAGLNLSGVIIIIICAPWISTFIFGSTDYLENIRIYSTVLFFSAVSEVPMAFIRAQEKPWLYVTFSTTKLLLQLSLNIFFVVHLGMAVEGVIYSGVISSAIMGTLLTSYTLYFTGFCFSKKLLRSILTFSAPLMVAALAMFYMNFIGKYLLRVSSGLTEVGLYSLSVKFGFILLALVASPFFGAWEPYRYKVYKEASAPIIFAKVFKVYSSILLFACLGLAMFATDLLKIMSGEEFWPAAQAVPFVLMAYLFQGWTQFCNFGVMLSGNTVQITYGTFLGATIMTALCWMLLEKYGATGAAFAAMCAFLARLIWIQAASNKFYKLKLPWASTLLVACLAASIFLASKMLEFSMITNFLLKIVLSLLFLIVLLISPYFDRDDRRNAFKSALEVVRKKKLSS